MKPGRHSAIRVARGWRALSALASLLLLAACDFGAPRPGARDFERDTLVLVGDVRVQLADGHVSSDRIDLILDTRVGPLEHGATFNAATKRWRWRHEMTLRDGVFVDASGARLDLSGVVDGAAIPGTHWVRLDANRVKTKGGLVHTFDPVDGRLAEVHWADGPYPVLRHVGAAVGGVMRTMRVEQCVDASTCSAQLVFEYDATGCLGSAVDRAGRRAEYVHDTACRTRVARDPFDVDHDFAGRRYEYGGAGRLRAIDTSEGERTEIDYRSERAGTIRRVGPETPTYRFTYWFDAAVGESTTHVTTPSGGRWSLDFDRERRLLRRISPEGEVVSQTWSGLRPATRTDADGRVWRFTYEDDELVRVDAPTGRVVHRVSAPDAVDRGRPRARPLARVVDALGVREERTYDASGRLASIVNGAAEASHFTWDALGQLASRTDATGRITTLSEYGEHGHPARVERAGVAELRLYDAVGNLVKGDGLEGELGPGRPGLVRRRFDADRNIEAVASIETDLAAGFIVTKWTTFERRSDGRMRRITTPYGGLETFTYDVLGHLVARTERVGGIDRPTSFEHDIEGRPVRAARPNGMVTSLAWDGDGRLARVERSMAGVEPESMALTYTGGRLIRVDDAAYTSPEWIRYDPDGRVRERLHPTGGRTTFEYDERGHTTRRRVFGAANGVALFETTHTWDGAGRIRATRLDGELLTERTWVDGELYEKRYGNGLTRSFDYHTETGALEHSQMVRADGVTIEDTIVEHSACWIEKICIDASAYVLLAGPVGGEPIERYASEHYRLDWSPAVRADGTPMAGPWMRMWATVPIGAEGDGDRVRFDALGNLAGFRPLGGTAVSFSFNAERNRLVSGGMEAEHAYVHDASGYVTERDGIALQWTPSGRIASIGNDVRLVWDSLGRPVERSIAGETRRYGFGGTVEIDAQGWPVATEIDGARVALGTTVRRYAHRDHRGNVQVVTDESGRVIRFHLYEGFGARAVVDRDGASRAPVDGERGFAGGLHIAGLQLLGARPYDPDVGRFLAPDPIDHMLNDFAYTRGNPLRLWDPGGLHATPVEGPGSGQALGQALVTGGEVTAMTGGAVAAAGVAAASPGAIVGGSFIYVIGMGMLYMGTKLGMEKEGPATMPPTVSPEAIDQASQDLTSPTAPSACAPSTFHPRRPRRSVVMLCVVAGILAWTAGLRPGARAVTRR